MCLEQQSSLLLPAPLPALLPELQGAKKAAGVFGSLDMVRQYVVILQLVT